MGYTLWLLWSIVGGVVYRAQLYPAHSRSALCQYLLHAHNLHEMEASGWKLFLFCNRRKCRRTDLISDRLLFHSYCARKRWWSSFSVLNQGDLVDWLGGCGWYFLAFIAKRRLHTWPIPKIEEDLGRKWKILNQQHSFIMRLSQRESSTNISKTLPHIWRFTGSSLSLILWVQNLYMKNADKTIHSAAHWQAQIVRVLF